MCKKLFLLMTLVLVLGLAADTAVAADYYLDPVSGSDTTGDGSLGNPWESFKNIITYYTSSYRPSGWVNMQPGDTIYLMNGTHNTIVRPGDGTGPGGGSSNIAYFRTKHGDSANLFHIKAYPGHGPVIDPQYNGKGFMIYQCSYWEIEGVEIKNASSRGIRIADSDYITVHNVHIYDTDGRNDNNVCGLEVNNSGYVEVYDSVFHDNYDRTGAQGHPANSTGMVTFNGFNPNHGDVIIHDCEFYQTRPTSEISGAGLKYKHANQNPDAVYHVYNCTFTNNKYFGFASGTANTHFHHNLINSGGSIRSKDEGGTTHQTNQLFEYNTVYESKAFNFNPSINYRNADFPNDPTNVVFQNNIIYHKASSYDKYSGMVDVGTYIEDDLYDITVAALTFSNNCYYNPNIACKFNFAGGGWASQGGSFTLSGWQAEYGYDTDSIEADPLFVDAANGDFHLQAGSPAEGMGMYAGLGPQPPGQASNPNPSNGATDISIDADLSWTAGSGSDSHDVYFGTSSPGTFQGNQAGTTFDPGTMANDTIYYWRIDEVNAEGTTTGNVWSFTTEAAAPPPGQASNPSPADGAIDVNVDADISWTAGSGSDSSDVYFGTDATPDAGEFQGNQTATTFDPGTMANDTTYYWRIDEVNAQGTTTGIVWSFTTEAVPPPGQASNPSPIDGAIDVSVDANLSWTAGSGSDSSDVYFGTSSPGTFQGNQAGTTFDPGTMANDTIYYWRIDEVNAGGTTTGIVWSFTTEAAPPPPPGQAGNPNPSNGATDVSVDADLSWTAGSGADSHDVYFGTSSPGTFQGNQAGTTFDPGTMANDTTYYWRIDEVNAGGTTTGIVWSFTTEVEAPPPTNECDNWQTLHPEWIFCDDFEDGTPLTDKYFEYDDDAGDFVIMDGVGVDNSRGMRALWQSSEVGAGSLKLGFGRVPSGYFDKGIRNTEDFRDVYHRIYLKTQSGWQGNPAKLSRAMIFAASDWSQAMIAHYWGSGAYYLSVDAVRCVDSSSNVKCVGYNDFANMDWIGAQAGTIPIFDTGYDGVWYCIESHTMLNDPGLSNGVTEYWIDGELDARREGLNFVYSYTDYGINAIFLENYWDTGSPQLQERYFDNFVVSTQPIGLWTPGPTPPGQASNPSPADGATGVSVDADLSWTAGSGSDSHDVYFGTSSPGSFQGNQAGTTFDPGAMANDTTYYWRIDEVNAGGTTTGTVWSFTTEAAPPPPPGQAGNPNPSNGATDISVDADLSWTAGSGADSHDVYFGTSSPGTFQGNQAGTTFDPGTMANNTTYYWRIDEVNTGGTTTGVVWSFTTVVPPPGQASNPNPSNGATDISIDADLSWTAGSGSDSHDVYFGTSSPGTFQGNQAGTTFDPGAMANDTVYYWRIDEVNAGGTTTGIVWSFTTEAVAPPPGQASNPSPIDGAIDVSVDADISWTAGSGSDSSDVYFGTDATPDAGEFQGNQAGTTFDPGTLANDTTYYWRIDEVNAQGTTTGVVWSFTTEIEAPPPTNECDNWQTLHPEWIFCDDFEDGTALVRAGRYFEYDDDAGDFIIVDGVGVNNSKGMRALWQSSETGAGSLKLGFGRNPSGYMDKGIRNTEDFRDVYYRIYLKMQPGWQGNPAKLSRATVIAASDWSQAMIAHYWTDGAYHLAVDPVRCVDSSSNVKCIGYNDYANMDWLGSQAGVTPIFDTGYDGVWYCIEKHVKLNDPGLSNGIQEFWIDGELDARRDGLNFVYSYTDYGINAIFLENYWDTGSPQLQERYIDNFVVSTQPIGCLEIGIDPNLIGWWKLDDGSGTTAVDSSGSGNNGTLYGNPAWVTGYIDGALEFPADSNEYVAISNEPFFDLTGDITVTTWMNANYVDWRNFSTIIAKGQDGAGWALQKASRANSISFYANVSGMPWDGVKGADGVFDGEWHHIAGVYDGSNAYLYVDGVDSNSIACSGSIGTNDWDVYIGNNAQSLDGGSNARVWEGIIDDVRVYNRALSASEIAELAGVQQPPGQATNPSPADGAIGVSIDADLSWTAGSGADSHDVYFGTSSPGTFQGNQAGTTFDPGILANDTIYYWRIDEVNTGGTTTGVVWSFTTVVPPPGQATNPSPSNGATDVSIDADLSWTAGSGATSHDVYFGTSSPGTFQGNQAGTTFDPGTMANDTTYYWRIDEVNAGGTTTGVVWSFTTAAAGVDVVTITKAEYKVSRSELKVEATSSQGGTAVLTVEGYGTMTYNSGKDLHQFREKPVADPGGTVTVTSSLGGSDIVSVTYR